ncbi:hypothetical protein V8E53_000376 [Lactarius tabidus]
MPGPPIVDLRNTYGAVFVGLLFNTLLTGLEIVQAWIYFNNYWDKDKKAFKFFVGFLTFIDILSTIIGAYSIYWYLVLNFGNAESLGYRLWATNLQSALNIFPGCAVQLYYLRRVYLVSQNIIFPIMMVPLVLGCALFGTVIAAKSNTIKSAADIHLILLLTRLWMSVLVVADISITVMMSWSLHRKRTGFARTDSMITTLMAYTINSGFVLTVLGVAVVISFSVSPSTLIYVPFVWVSSKCYMNSLYAMLNTRNYVRDRSTTGNSDRAYNVSSIRIGPQSEASGSKSRQPAVTVTVHRSTTSDFARSKSDQSIAPNFEDSKPV